MAGQDPAGTGPAIPVFRIFSVELAMAFYVDFLGFTLDWEHRFEDGFPLYCQVSRGETKIHLSEHAGDAVPGARAYVWVEDIEALHEEFSARSAPNVPPIHPEPWGREVEVVDPFGNRITFAQAPS